MNAEIKEQPGLQLAKVKPIIDLMREDRINALPMALDAGQKDAAVAAVNRQFDVVKLITDRMKLAGAIKDAVQKGKAEEVQALVQGAVAKKTIAADEAERFARLDARDDGALAWQPAVEAGMDAQKLARIKNKDRLFAGDIAEALGAIDAKAKERVLQEQTEGKARAAAIDIATIAEHGAQAAPAFLQPNYGNGKVNAAVPNPSRTDGVSAAANIAQNFVMEANRIQDPAQAKALAAELRPAVEAAGELAGAIAGKGQLPLTDERAKQLKEQIERGFRVLEAHGITPAFKVKGEDGTVKDVPLSREQVEQYIKERFKDIDGGVAQQLQRQAELKKRAEVAADIGGMPSMPVFPGGVPSVPAR